MRSTTRILLSFALVSAVAMVIAPALHADDDHAPSSSTMGRMMGRGIVSGMMGPMHMMDHCGAMMGGDYSRSRPNEQWRAPRPPDGNGKR